MGRLISLPDVEMELDLMVPMRDGVCLATDVYRPAGALPVAALVLRTPYGKSNVEAEAYAHPSWYVSRGFAVVSQDVRGRWDSQGEFVPFATEAADGADTYAWVAAQSWCDGSVGSFGFSYPGATQMLASACSPHLKAMAPAMTGASFWDGWTYRNGVLNLAFVISWAFGLGRDQAVRAGDMDAVQKFDDLMADPDRLYATLPVRGVLPKELLCYAPYLADWLEHRDYDDYWRRHSPMENYPAMGMPALHIAGWYDVFLEPTIDNFSALAARAEAHQMLVVGPWYHMPWSQYVGELDFGDAGKNNIDELQVRFFERWLKDKDNGIDREAPVHLFVMGKNTWRHESEWPPAAVRTQTLYFASDGRATSLNGTGRLDDAPLSGDSAPAGFLANPRGPVLSLGGRSGSNPAVAPMGPVDQRAQEVRNDVLVFTGEPLQRGLTVIGYPEVVLHVAATVVTCDFVVRLVDVYPDGRAINLCDGFRRLDEMSDGVVSRIEIRLSPIANYFAVGHCLRVEIAGSDFPGHERNPHCDVDSFDATVLDLKMASQFVYHDGRYVSFLQVPVVDE